MAVDPTLVIKPEFGDKENQENTTPVRMNMMTMIDCKDNRDHVFTKLQETVSELNAQLAAKDTQLASERKAVRVLELEVSEAKVVTDQLQCNLNQQRLEKDAAFKTWNQKEANQQQLQQRCRQLEEEPERTERKSQARAQELEVQNAELSNRIRSLEQD